MGEHSKIEWTESSWNPIRGMKGDWHCTKVSEGCKFCYAEALNHRFGGPAYTPGADRFRLDTRILRQPFSWSRPRKIFVCSMTDLFHEDVREEWIAEVLRVIERNPSHTFQVLTKRALRMKSVLSKLLYRTIENLWIGISCENGERYRERVPALALTPGAAVRFVSFEPLLEPIGDLFLDGGVFEGCYQWGILGGESGSQARTLDTSWLEDIIRQSDQRVRIFVKQLGSNVVRNGRRLPLKHIKGGDIGEWPAMLRIREFPN